MEKQPQDGKRYPEFVDLLIPWKRRQGWGSWQELLAPSVITDKLDYRPGETAMITASGFRPGETITFSIADDPQDPGDDGDADLYQPFSVKDGGAGELDGKAHGQVVTTWFVPTDDDGSGSGTPDALNASLLLTAMGSEGQMASVMFTDSGATVVTDKADYAPGETVTITASGFAQGSTIEFAIADDPSRPGDDGEVDVYMPFWVIDGGEGDLDGGTNGEVVARWIVPADNNGTGLGEPDALNGTLILNTKGSDGQVASTTFTDGLPPTLNLTYSETKGFYDPDGLGPMGSALFANSTFKAGTGSVDSFVRVQAAGNQTWEQGYNSDFRPKQFDEDTSGQRNKSQLTTSVPIAYVGPTPYLEFRLDVNESQTEKTTYLSLDALKFYVTNNPNITGFSGATTVGTIPPDTSGTFPIDGINAATLVWNLDAGGLDRWAGLKVNPGSGIGDLSVYIPATSFYTILDPLNQSTWTPKASNIVLYSAFGYQPTTNGSVSQVPPNDISDYNYYPSTPQEWSAQGGFEEWFRGIGRPVQASDLKGFKFYDSDRDGIYNNADLKWTAANGFVTPVTIYLDSNDNGQLDSGERTTTTSSLDGSYTFTNLVVGLGELSTYNIREIVPSGFIQTAPLAGEYDTGVPGEKAIVADYFDNGIYDPTIKVELKTAQVTYDLPAFGNADQEFSFLLGGLKWHDRDVDGVPEPAATPPEEPLGEWIIIFDTDGNGPDLNDITATTTPGTGLYTLGVEVEAGTYFVYEQLQNLWYQSFPNPVDETDGYGGRYRVEVAATGVVTVYRDDPGGTVTVDNQALNFGNFQPAFTITKTGDLLSKIGDPVDYTITIVNTGDGFLSNALVVDNVLGDLLSEANPYVTSILGDNGTLGVLDYGETWTINATRVVQPGDTDPLPNTVTATFTIPYSVDTLSSSDDHVVDLFQPSIDVTKTGTALSKIGDPVDYTITVTNNSSADTPTMYFDVTDPL
ncbi:MAG: hypothetical protein ACK531_10725, partial [Cyanobacteriota bacterium]